MTTPIDSTPGATDLGHLLVVASGLGALSCSSGPQVAWLVVLGVVLLLIRSSVLRDVSDREAPESGPAG